MDRTSVLLGLIIAALAATLYLERQAGLFAPAPIEPLAAAGAAPGETGLATDAAGDPDLQEGAMMMSALDPGFFYEMSERPLFNPSRRPFDAADPSEPRGAAVRAAGAGAAAIRSRRLVATARNGDRKVALLFDPATGEHSVLTLGETFLGWRLVSIEEGGVEFRRAGEDAEAEGDRGEKLVLTLAIRTPGAAGAAPRRRTPPTVPQGLLAPNTPTFELD